MDEQVRQAMARWPNVPHCFGWLRLDARGAWRMRDERAQALELAGEPIRHPALLEFINRNYASDDGGRWYFQNGPQRVFVDLELTPYIARTRPGPDGLLSLVLHTGAEFVPTAAWMDADGRLYLEARQGIAALDDRDLAELLPALRLGILDGEALEQALLEWLQGRDDAQASPPPTLAMGRDALPLARLMTAPAQQFGFVAKPRG